MFPHIASASHNCRVLCIFLAPKWKKLKSLMCDVLLRFSSGRILAVTFPITARGGLSISARIKIRSNLVLVGKGNRELGFAV
jgi:hypothetical protein